MHLGFTSKVEFKSVTNQLFGTIAGVKVPFPLPDNEKSGCNTGIQCPLKPNATYYDIVTIPILSSYPVVSFDDFSLIQGFLIYYIFF